MSCGSCATRACGDTRPKGCKNNGNCTSGGCTKLNSFDWLARMKMPKDMDNFNTVEIKFKGGRKDIFKNVNHLELFSGDPVVIQVQSGYDLGYVSLQGELAYLQAKKKEEYMNSKGNDSEKKIIRIATKRDLDEHLKVKEREIPALFVSRNKANGLNLKMKISDVEFQFDNTKATFYYSSKGRIDFRELVRLLGAELKTRIEMKQIHLRQEAGRIGGIGSCGKRTLLWYVAYTVQEYIYRSSSLSKSFTKYSKTFRTMRPFKMLLRL